MDVVKLFNYLGNLRSTCGARFLGLHFNSTTGTVKM